MSAVTMERREEEKEATEAKNSRPTSGLHNQLEAPAFFSYYCSVSVNLMPFSSLSSSDSLSTHLSASSLFERKPGVFSEETAFAALAGAESYLKLLSSVSALRASRTEHLWSH